jgi:hypothetical protein
MIISGSSTSALDFPNPGLDTNDQDQFPDLLPVEHAIITEFTKTFYQGRIFYHFLFEILALFARTVTWNLSKEKQE